MVEVAVAQDLVVAHQVGTPLEDHQVARRQHDRLVRVVRLARRAGILLVGHLVDQRQRDLHLVVLVLDLLGQEVVADPVRAEVEDNLQFCSTNIFPKKIYFQANFWGWNYIVQF